MIAALERAGFPSTGTAAHEQLEEAFLHELAVSGDQSPPWGVVGAFGIATNFLTDEGRSRPAFLAIMDFALLVLRDDGVAYPAIPPFALSRWQETHGFSGIGPAQWPRALENLTVPSLGEELPVADLDSEETRKLVCDGPSADARTTYAMRTQNGSIVAVIDGVDVSDGVRKKWEPGISGATYVAFLRELGDRLVSAPWWTHSDLLPYIPCRQRSRDQMREAARCIPDTG